MKNIADVASSISSVFGKEKLYFCEVRSLR